MKTKIVLSGVLVFALSTLQFGFSQVVKNSDNWGKQGITKQSDNIKGTVINYSLTEYSFIDIVVNGEQMKSVVVPDVFLPNEEGAPDLPGSGKYLAVPEGATVSYKILSSRTDTLHNINIAPAPRIPLDTEDGPLHYEKNMSIYSQNAFYPLQPVNFFQKTELRGISAVQIGIIPFQYNPVTKELIVYKDMVIQVSFEGGSGKVGNNRSRSRYWDSMLNSLVLNTDIIPSVDYESSSQLQLKSADAGSSGCDYLIITPNNPDFLAWADSIKQFRTLQGILTNVATTSQIGGNTVSAIKSYVDNAYLNWTIPPAAVLLLGDYDTNAMSTTGITSQLYVHPAGYPDFASDNKFADVTGDDLPDIVFARIPATNVTQLSVMVSKFINYERNPPTKSAFYNTPITALGWQTDRWFQLCSEVVSGYLKNVKGKTPIRINALYSGSPTTDPWSTAGNTSTILNYFGPNGLKYIPATPQETGGFTGGTAAAISTAINNGSFMLVHRDHGNYSGWGEPAFNTTSINSLHNVNNELPFIFSVNCETGAFHRSTECFAEKFQRYTYNGQNSGALGIIAATEVSYSFANDTYLWGVFDNMFPDFMPDNNSTFPVSFVMPAFANAAGKYYLSQSNWVGSAVNQITYRLFHHFGDAFMTLYTEVPKALTIAHASSLQSGATSFSVTADAGSFIALVVNGSIVGKANGTGSPVVFTIPAQNAGDILNVTVTKQNYFRYSSKVKIGAASLVAEFSGTPVSIVPGSKVTYTDLSTNNPTAWSWSFPGGTPSTSTLKNPVVTYSTTGNYNVSLTASNSTESNSKTKTAYITVSSSSPVANFSANKTTIIPGQIVTYTDLSTSVPTSWSWSFPGGTPSTSAAQNPSVTYASTGNYSVTLTASNVAGSNTITKTSYITVGTIPVAGFTANMTSVSIGEAVSFSDLSSNNPTSWSWSFPGGTPATSTLQNPSVTYASIGSYNVTLTATNGYGSNIIVKTAYVTVGNSMPVINFSANKTSVIAGEVVSYTDLSTNNPTSWVWSFPGGTPSSSSMQNPSVTYASAGSYDVTLSASNSTDVNSVTKTAYISVGIPIPLANFSANKTSVLTGETITYSDLSSNNPTSWLWSFPGGTPSTSTLQNPVVTYSSPGIYSASLTASNTAGSSSQTKTGYITVNVLPPVAGFSADATRILTGGNVNFRDLSTGNPTLWSWSFEGGTPSASTLQNPIVSYSTDGTYNVSLTVSNPGGSNTKSQAGFITVWNGTVTYCSSGSISSTTEWISQVKFGTFLKASGSSSYTDYTAQEIVLTPGSKIACTLTPGFASKFRKEYWKIWMDLNNDGDFTDASENIYSGSSAKGSISGTLSIPASASGITRMRVSMKYGSAPLPCETFGFGEVEDYTANFSLDAMPENIAETSSGFKIYPNPTTDFVIVETGFDQSEAFIYSLNGTLLKHLFIMNHDQIDLQEFSRGVYYMKILNNGEIFVQKIVKQ